LTVFVRINALIKMLNLTEDVLPVLQILLALSVMQPILVNAFNVNLLSSSTMEILA
jgi:hypothetical protein